MQLRHQAPMRQRNVAGFDFSATRQHKYAWITGTFAAAHLLLELVVGLI